MVRWKYLKHMIWKPGIYKIFVGSQEAELKWLPLFQKRFLRVNKAYTEDVKAEVKLGTTAAMQLYLFICLLVYFLIYIFNWSPNPSHPAEKDTFTLTSSSSPPLPVGPVGLNGTGFYIFVPLRDGFLGGWEFPLPDGEEGKAAALCSDPTPAAASACGRKGWAGHCSHLRAWRAGSFCLRTWRLCTIHSFHWEGCAFLWPKMPANEMHSADAPSINQA